MNATDQEAIARRVRANVERSRITRRMGKVMHPPHWPLTGLTRLDRPAYYEEERGQYFRPVGEAHKILRLRYTGWHCHHDGIGELAVGKVWRLPARNGAERYLAGFSTGCGYHLIEREAFPTERDAAIRADGMAERFAEEEREHSEAWEAAVSYNGMGDSLEIVRDEIRDLVAMYRDEKHRERRKTLYALLGERTSARRRLIRDRAEAVDRWGSWPEWEENVRTAVPF